MKQGRLIKIEGFGELGGVTTHLATIEIDKGDRYFKIKTFFIEAKDELEAFQEVQRIARAEGITLLGDEDE
jgi:hypothetical protein